MIADQPNPYETLGVSPGATPEECRQQYRKLAKEHHPDRGGDPAHMAQLSAAIDQIENPKKVDDANAVQILSSMFAAVIKQGHNDLVKAVQRQLSSEINKQDSQLSKLQETAAELSAHQDRVRGESQILRQALANEVAATAAAELRAVRLRACFVRAREIVADYGYERPDPAMYSHKVVHTFLSDSLNNYHKYVP